MITTTAGRMTGFLLSISQFGLPHVANLNKFYHLGSIETTGAPTLMTLKTTMNRIGDLIAIEIALNRDATAMIGERTMTEDLMIVEGQRAMMIARLRIGDGQHKTSDAHMMTGASGSPRRTSE